MNLSAQLLSLFVFASPTASSKAAEPPEDLRRAVKALQKGCEGGSAKGCKDLSILLARGAAGVPQDAARSKELAAKANALFLKDCKAGTGDSCTEAGFYAEREQRDAKAAQELYARGCELRSPTGCFDLAIMYERGSGPARDMKKAVFFYDRACDMDDAEACGRLGKLLLMAADAG